ncbi:MAG: AMP-binding protein [Polyangiales bacterium]
MSTLLALHAPDALVCFGGEGGRDAAQLAAYAKAIAAALPRERGDARVVLACADRYRFAAGLLAIWRAGYTAELPVNGQPATLRELAAAPGVIASLHDRDDGIGLDARTLEAPDARAALPAQVALAANAPAVIAYTSGSTGKPVAHVKGLAQLLAEPEAQLAAFALAHQRVVAAVAPQHIYGLLFGVLVPLLGGGSFSRGTPLLPAELLREIARASAQVLVAVPPHLAALAAHGEGALPALARVFSSAAPLPAATSIALRARGMRVTEVLGSTETGGIATRSDPDAAWQPLPGVHYEVDGAGQLAVDAPWLAPDAPRPVPTADRVAREPDGKGFRHLGRSDAVVKVGGRRIDLGELETRLARVAGVREARVLAIETPGMRGLELVAVVAGEAHLRAGELRRALVEHVDPVALPRRFRVVDALPRTPTGKLLRADLIALFDARAFPRMEGDDGTTRFAVPADSVFFEGHFDGRPILPGVVQLWHVALREARRQHPDLGSLARVTRVKFKRTIAPGETLALRLERKGALAVHFTLDADGLPTASGILHFRAGAREPSEDAP